MELRDYQREAVEVVDNLPEGSKSVVAIATGLGKTVIGANFHCDGKMLWISHRDELVRQPERYFAEQGRSFAIEKAGEHPKGDEDVVSASIQSLSRDNRLEKYKPDDFEIVVVDEAHHAAAASYRKVLDYFKPKKLIGLTATPKRGDNVRLSDIFDSICFTRDLKWGIKNEYLSRIRCVIVHADFDMKKLVKAMGEYTLSSVDEALMDSNADIVVTKAYLEYCLPQHRQTLIYCPTIRVCHAMQATMVAAVPEEEKDTIKVLSDKTPKEERQQILADYLEGKVHAILNCMILSEGTDLPNTSCVINTRVCASQTLYQQIVGRGTRLYPGKEYCLVIDVVGDNGRYRSLCTAPTLFGIDPSTLPEKMVEKIDDSVDLLELSEQIAAVRARTAQAAELKAKMFELFRIEREELIKKYAPEGYAAVAAAYTAFIEEESESGTSFGDIVVKRMYTDEHYYKIQPTFNGAIYLSYPDALNFTTMDFHIPADENLLHKDIDFVSDNIDMEDAIKFIRGFLEDCIDPYYAQKWSKTARGNLGNQEPTDKQVWRVKKDMLPYRVKQTSMSRLAATDLIDLRKELVELQDEKNKMEMREREISAPRTGTVLERWNAKQDEEQRKLEEAAMMRRKRADSQIADIKAFQKKKELFKESVESYAGKTMAYTYKLDFRYFPDRSPASKAQITFVQNLLQELKAVNCTLDREFDITQEDIDMGHTGFLINYLLEMRRQVSKFQELGTMLCFAEAYHTIRIIWTCREFDHLTAKFKVLGKKKEEKEALPEAEGSREEV